ncbi:hypothetical protein D1B33_10185 [Lysinibacillus yapensis]|uniref:Uncharacterized protein n=1 Tax=Ureibacillus yapensis TaxID=2304605 RepID=A0A396S7B7_9BACL|nr:hypothetical protein [Lysinibacillus yapensis]RHW36751.1 hypothetical protein D1B33_10185 [Lysinibacillus yapensis]
MANLSTYEEQLREKYVDHEEVVKVGEKTFVCVLSLKGGYEHIGHATDNNSTDDKFTDNALREKARKAAYESLENYDRFHEAYTKVSGAI